MKRKNLKQGEDICLKSLQKIAAKSRIPETRSRAIIYIIIFRERNKIKERREKEI